MTTPSPYASVMDDSQLTGRPIVLPGAGPFGGEGAIIIGGHSQAESGGANFAGLQEAAAGDTIRGCNDDQRCFTYLITRAEAWTPAALQSAFTAQVDTLLIFTDRDTASFYVLTTELEK